MVGHNGTPALVVFVCERSINTCRNDVFDVGCHELRDFS